MDVIRTIDKIWLGIDFGYFLNFDDEGATSYEIVECRKKSYEFFQI
jgi:hypothetical protein